MIFSLFKKPQVIIQYRMEDIAGKIFCSEKSIYRKREKIFEVCVRVKGIIVT